MGDPDSDRSNQTPTSRLAAAAIAMFRASATGCNQTHHAICKVIGKSLSMNSFASPAPLGGLIEESSRLRHPLGYLAQC